VSASNTNIGIDQSLYIDLMKKTLSASIYEESSWSIVECSDPAWDKKKSLGANTITYVKQLINNCEIRSKARRSLLIVKKNRFNAEARDGGLDWPLFGLTMVGRRRLDNIQTCIEYVIANNVPGDIIETGAWRGGAMIFARAMLKLHGITDRKVWVADSFEGLPRPKSEADGWDYSKVDALKVSLEQVKSNFERFGMLDEQVEFLKGWFADTLPTAPIERLAILRLDGDMYSSTMDSLVNLYDKVSPGGFVIVDDYHSWPSCKAAVTDFIRQRNIAADIRDIDKGGAYWQVGQTHPQP
jgi:hypothetical protein